MEIGRIEGLFPYPVKSMRGERLATATLGWHGLEGDRRLALRRLADRGGFPWLTAGRLPDLIRFTPRHDADVAPDALPGHVVTPDGEALPVFGEALAAEIARRHGAPVELTHLKHGIFDDATVSVIAADTVSGISGLAGVAPDVRRFRPNIVLALHDGRPFQEDAWVGRVLAFGDGEDAPAVAITMRDIRCAMVNLDPDSAAADPAVLKAVVRANQNGAGVYATVTRNGRLAVGQTIYLR
jgi:uncharacterized protein YcbX